MNFKEKKIFAPWYLNNYAASPIDVAFTRYTCWVRSVRVSAEDVVSQEFVHYLNCFVLCGSEARDDEKFRCTSVRQNRLFVLNLGWVVCCILLLVMAKIYTERADKFRLASVIMQKFLLFFLNFINLNIYCLIN